MVQLHALMIKLAVRYPQLVTMGVVHPRMLCVVLEGSAAAQRTTIVIKKAVSVKEVKSLPSIWCLDVQTPAVI